jgi:lipoate-protein ligase A
LSIQKWRFINSGNNCGHENMALDEALLQSFDPHESLPVLRFYGWSPPALSLGRFQKLDDILDRDRCRTADVPVVRRITGGGVIFHADEITYSIICAPHQIPESNSIKESFRVLTGFLIQFYQSLGLDPCYAVDCIANGEELGERTQFCFAGRETFDILINGRKIGGNAQRRMRQVIFQHGSIPLIGRFREGVRFLHIPPLGLDGRVTCLLDEGIAPDSEFLKVRLKGAFSNNLEVLLMDDLLTGDEQELAARLKNEKYLNENWNLRGEGV